MTEITNALMYEVLKTIQSDMTEVKGDVRVLKESIQRIDAKISAMDGYMAGFHSNLNWHRMDMEDLSERVTTLETADPAPPSHRRTDAMEKNADEILRRSELWNQLKPPIGCRFHRAAPTDRSPLHSPKHRQ